MLLSRRREVRFRSTTVAVALKFCELADEIVEKLRGVLSHSLEEFVPKPISRTASLHRVGPGHSVHSAAERSADDPSWTPLSAPVRPPMRRAVILYVSAEWER